MVSAKYFKYGIYQTQVIWSDDPSVNRCIVTKPEVFINSISDFCLQINKNKFVYDTEVLTLINCIFAEDRWSNLNCSHLLSQICLGLLFPLFSFCNSHVRVSHVIKLKLKPRRDGKPGWKFFFWGGGVQSFRGLTFPFLIRFQLWLNYPFFGLNFLLKFC